MFLFVREGSSSNKIQLNEKKIRGLKNNWNLCMYAAAEEFFGNLNMISLRKFTIIVTWKLTHELWRLGCGETKSGRVMKKERLLIFDRTLQRNNLKSQTKITSDGNKPRMF